MVGIARDSHFRGIERPPEALLYEPLARIDRQLGQQRLFAWLLGLLGTIGFVLAAVGLHGLIGQTVVERRREFGFRLAIGATPAGIVTLVLRRAALVLSVGLAAGHRSAGLCGRRDRVLLVGTAATIVPVRRALRVSPIVALRAE